MISIRIRLGMIARVPISLIIRGSMKHLVAIEIGQSKAD